MSIRLSAPRFERLRLEAFERRISMSAILSEALDEHWQAKGADGSRREPWVVGQAVNPMAGL